MTAEELLEKVKIGLNITGTYQDETLKTYINDVKAFCWMLAFRMRS